MNVSYSANAVYAKAHALYGQRLLKQNYDDLLNCRSLTELVNYLKTQTAYSSAFDNVPSDISAAQIEEILKLRLLEKFEAICRYEISAGENVYEYFIIQNDIKQILSMIRLLIAGTPEKYLGNLPPFFNKHSDLDLYKMAGIKSYDELIEALNGTPYAQLLVPFRDNYNQKGIYISVESALNNYLKETLFSIVDKKMNRKEKAQLLEMVNYKFDMETVVNIYRLIRLEDADETIIKNYINTKFTNFSKKEINMLAQAPFARDMMKLMPETYYRKDFAKVEYSYLEGTVKRVMYNKFSKSIRYFTNPVATMLCYVFLSENEVGNITRIVEGIKYKIPTENIRSVLVGAE